MVADMLSLAAVGGLDVAVLVSGDADHAPAVEGARGLGKKVIVATWGRYGLSSRITKAAFSHIDLSAGVELFGTAPKQRAPAAEAVRAAAPGPSLEPRSASDVRRPTSPGAISRGVVGRGRCGVPRRA